MVAFDLAARYPEAETIHLVMDNHQNQPAVRSQSRSA